MAGIVRNKCLMPRRIESPYRRPKNAPNAGRDTRKACAALLIRSKGFFTTATSGSAPGFSP
jgi:hypothetical protein